MSGNPFSALANAQQRQQGGGSGGGAGQGRGGRGRNSVASSTLKRAGLIDEDSGMRDASASGPSRRGGGGGGRGGRGSRQASSMMVDNERANGGGPRARDRANPMGGRPSRGRSNATSDVNVRGQAFGIRGAAVRGKGNPPPVAELISGGKGKGRVPGGGVGGAGGAIGAAPSQQTTGRTIALMKRFLQSRWDPAALFLNLENMATDPILAEEGLKPPGTPGAHKDINRALFKLCKELFPNVTTVSLAKNDFKTLIPIATMPEFLPDIKNLSLESNDIKWTRDLAFHVGKFRSANTRFNQLNELVLNGNPVHDNAVAAGNEEGYRAEVLARFPQLRMLDKKPVSEQEHNFASLPGKGQGKEKGGASSGAASAKVEVRDFPVAIRTGFAMDEAVNGVIAAFLSKYFEFFDRNRDSLRAAYSANATFSLVIVRSVPPRAKHAGYIHTMPRQRDLNWRNYKDVTDHNIMQLGTRSASKGFPRGPGAILATFNKFPKTTHPLTDPSKFVVDGWIVPNAAVNATLSMVSPNDRSSGAAQVEKPQDILFISVHGEFAEAPSQGVRSFDRTFVVAPAPPGSMAANLGWPCVIITDQLTIRNYAGTDAWSPQAQQSTPAGAPAPQGVPAATSQPAQQGQAPAPGLAPEQHSLAVELAARTKLKYSFAVQCLADNQWNPQMAMQRFEELRASIPAEAFDP